MDIRPMILAACLVHLPNVSLAEDRRVTLYAPPALIETGLLKHILPRFSLKTQVRVSLSETSSDAEIVLGETGRALFDGLGQTWHMDVLATEDADAARLADWLKSEVGQNTILGFAPDGAALFSPPSETTEVEVVEVLPGDATLGLDVAREKCTRCHAVDDKTRMSGIGSTPSFSVLRTLNDWENRFATFYVLKPHPSFMIVDELGALYPEDRPPPIVPVEMTLDEVEAVLAYVSAMPAADLGAPLQHQ